MRWKAVLFDLFDTLVLFERERLPLVRVNGRTLHSTAGALHELVRAHAPGVDLGRFVDALLWRWQEAERLRAIDHREIAAPARFRLLFERLGVGARQALFVGDRPDIDVAGAHAVEIDAVWINRAGAPLPDGVRPPQFEIRDLTELPAIVGA